MKFKTILVVVINFRLANKLTKQYSLIYGTTIDTRKQ